MSPPGGPGAPSAFGWRHWFSPYIAYAYWDLSRDRIGTNWSSRV